MLWPAGSSVIMKVGPAQRTGQPSRAGQERSAQRAVARRARSTASPITAPRASTSCCDEVWPRENRSDPRALASSAPMASSTWLGCAMPAVQAEPVEQAMPFASSSMSSASPSQPGNEKWALPGSLPGPGGAPFSTASGTAASTRAISQRERLAVGSGGDGDGRLGAGGEGPDRRGVERAGPHVAFLAAAMQNRHQIRAPADQ